MSVVPSLSEPGRAESVKRESPVGTVLAAPLLPGARDRLVLCATGPDETGTPSVALWRTDLSGEPKAGWLFPEERAERDPRVAGRLLLAATYGRAAQRRDGTGWALLARLADATGHARPATAVLDVDDLVAGVRRRTGRTPAPRDTDGSRRCPVVTELLATCDLVGWATRAWAAAPEPGPSPVAQWLRQAPVPAGIS
jgi:hypothetical protein